MYPEEDWVVLTEAVRSNACLAFVGAGANSSATVDTSGAELARVLAEGEKYPLSDKENLPRVAQYIYTKYDNRDTMLQKVSSVLQDKIDLLDGAIPEILGQLAGLSLPLYVTTNYDTLMERALDARGDCIPQTDVCRWLPALKIRENGDPILSHQRINYDALNSSNAVVYHLHGIFSEPDTMLITEDDYISFMVNYFRNSDDKPSHIEPQVLRRLVKNHILFVGYSLNDWNLRFLLRFLYEANGTRRPPQSISIQFDKDNALSDAARWFVLRSLAMSTLPKLSIYWGDAAEFLATLRGRLDA